MSVWLCNVALLKYSDVVAYTLPERCTTLCSQCVAHHAHCCAAGLDLYRYQTSVDNVPSSSSSSQGAANVPDANPPTEASSAAETVVDPTGFGVSESDMSAAPTSRPAVVATTPVNVETTPDKKHHELSRYETVPGETTNEKGR